MFRDPIQRLNRLYYHWKRGRWIIDHRTYLGNYENMPIDRPIFLLDVQCGGLTLVSRMLSRQPSVVSVTGNYRYWSGADEMHTVLDPILPAELTGLAIRYPILNILYLIHQEAGLTRAINYYLFIAKIH